MVLVVDDSPATLGMLNEALEAAGYTVLIAQSGMAALALIGRITPDIVLMDALMPAMDGFETCRQIKRTPEFASVPIIFMTGLTETEHVLRGLEAGGVDYVVKPVAPDEVVARVGVHLANARLTRSAQVALDTSGRFLLAVNRAGRVLWSTPQAARLLAAGQAEVAVLPASIRDWVADCAANSAGPRPAQIQLVLAPGQAVELSYIGQVSPDELLLRVVAATRSGEDTLLKERLGLTGREAEVLLWLGRGKSNRDIAEILALSPRTVNKHLEQIYAKLGVENRAAAAVLATRTLGGN